VSDFATGKDSRFAADVDEFEKDKQDALLKFYSSANGTLTSPFYRYTRLYGALGAEILTVVALNSLTPLSEGLMTVREVAWTIYPGAYLGIVADVLDKVDSLAKEGMLRILPEARICYLESAIMPAEELMDEFASYLRGQAGTGQVMENLR